MLDCQKYFEVTGRRITFEYTLMAGVNDSPDQVPAAVAAKIHKAYAGATQLNDYGSLAVF